MFPNRALIRILCALATSSVAGAAYSQSDPNSEEGSEDSWISADPVQVEAPPPPSPPEASPAPSESTPTPVLPPPAAPAPAAVPGAASAPAPKEPVPRATVRVDFGRAPAQSKARALLGNHGRPAYGGYGGLSVGATRIAGRGGILVGGEAAVTVDHRLAFGIAGMGLATETPGRGLVDGLPSRLAFGYGGLILRCDLLMDGPVYFSVGALVGAGGVGLFATDHDRWERVSGDRTYQINGFFVAEPSLRLNLNLTRWLRIGATAAYRWVSGVQFPNYRNEDFRGLTLGGVIQFGRF